MTVIVRMLALVFVLMFVSHLGIPFFNFAFLIFTCPSPFLP
jgi:hypothetical protein